MSWFSENIWDPLVGNTDPNAVRSGMLQGIDQGAYTDAAADYKRRGEAFFDPGSGWNLDIKNTLMGMGADSMAQQNLMNTQNQAKFGGGGGFSGALSQAAEATGQNTLNSTVGNWGNQFRQNMSQGTQFMNMGDQQRGQLNSLLTGANTAKVQQMQQNSANTGGMLQGIAGAMMPGIGSMATNFGMNALGMSGEGGGMGGMEAFMQPYAQKAQNRSLLNNAYMNYLQPGGSSGGSGAGGGGGFPSWESFQGGGNVMNPNAMWGGGGNSMSPYSDIRLKDNVTHIGTDKGYNIYSWDWNKKALELGIDTPTYGVMAQEVLDINPDAVGLMDNGYYAVNYGAL